MKPKKYRKMPVVVEAMQYTGENYEDICRFANMMLDKDAQENLLIPTLEGTMRAWKKDYIIKGVKGELYPIKEDIFFQTYEEVMDE